MASFRGGQRSRWHGSMGGGRRRARPHAAAIPPVPFLAAATRGAQWRWRSLAVEMAERRCAWAAEAMAGATEVPRGARGRGAPGGARLASHGLRVPSRRWRAPGRARRECLRRPWARRRVGPGVQGPGRGSEGWRVEGSRLTQESMGGRESDEVIRKGKEREGRCDRDATRVYSASAKSKGAAPQVSQDDERHPPH